MYNYEETRNKNCGCEENFDCECQVIDLGTKCIIYDGDYLEKLNIQKNTDLTTVIKKIDYFFTNGGMPTYVNVINLGTGIGIYKGTDNLNRLGFKSIQAKTEVVEITEQADTVNIGINEGVLKEMINDVYAPTEYIFTTNSFVQSYANNILTFKKLASGSNINIADNGETITISSTGGQGITNIQSDTLSIQTITGGYKIDTPKDFRRRIYVNNTYSSPNADGTLSKPFLTIQKAIDAYVGTGTPLNPQFFSQGVIIHVQMTGIGHDIPDSLLVKGLELYLEEGVLLANVINHNNTYIIDFDSLPSSEGTFQINISGAGRDLSFINLSRPFCRNTGHGTGVSNGSHRGRNLNLKNVRVSRVVSTSSTNAMFSTQTNYFVEHHNNNQSPFDFINVEFRGNTSAPLFYLGNSSNLEFNNCKIFFTVSSDSSSTAIQPFFWGGVYTRFKNCHIICYNNFTTGAFLMKNGLTQGTMEMFDCQLEGNISSLFTFSPDAIKQKLNVRGATPTFQNFGKVISSSDGDVTTVMMMSNIFTSPKGEVDLTMGNTISVSNHFNNKLTESLIKSPTVLNRTNQPEGTAYIHTAGSVNQADWKRTLVY